MRNELSVRIIGWRSPSQRMKRFVRYGQFFASNVRQRSLAFTVDKVARIIASDPHRLFDHIEIETINRCNGVCSFCPVNKRADIRAFASMSDQLFKKIIDDLGSLHFSGKIALRANNEPMLDDKLCERVRYAKERCPDAFVYFSTNGTLLSTQSAWEFIEAGIDLIWANNYSYDERLHSNLQQLVADFKTAPYNSQAAKIKIVLRKVDEVLTNRAGAAPNKLPDQDQTYRFFQDGACRLPFQQIVVRPDGKISLCSNDAYGAVTLGDLNEQDLLQVWYGDEFMKVREDLLQKGRKGLRLCNKCDAHMFDADALHGLAATRVFRRGRAAPGTRNGSDRNADGRGRAAAPALSLD